MERSAIISKNGIFRWSLSRTWDTDLPTVLYIGYNPSTADAQKDDATITRLIHFSKAHGYGGFSIVNLSPYRSTDSKDPKFLRHIGRRHRYISHCTIRDIHYFMVDTADLVFMWGRHRKLGEMAKLVIGLYPEALCFGHNGDGSPKHPLFLSNDTKLIKYDTSRQ